MGKRSRIISKIPGGVFGITNVLERKNRIISKIPGGVFEITNDLERKKLNH